MSVNTDFELIFVIANEGYTDMIMDAARSAGIPVVRSADELPLS